jgi:glycine cleavage system H protein
MQIPPDLKFSEDHEWAQRGDEGVRIGITDYAQDALGDVVFVALPTVGNHVEAGAPIGEIESTKSVSEVYAPVSGTIAAVNDALGAAPELVNQDPYGEGWICLIHTDDEVTYDALLDAAAYGALTNH